MNNRQFVEGYRQPPSHIRYNDDTPEVRQLMEGPRKWASFFDRQMVLYLKGEQRDEPASIYRKLNEYNNEWLSEHLDETIGQSREMAFEDIYSPSSAVNELNFHILNRGFAPMWRRLLVPEIQDPLGPDQIKEMQTRLALQGLSLVAATKKAEEREAIEGLRPIISRKISSQITEVDTAIVGLEELIDDSLSDNPHLVLVPAPPRFEAGYENGAAAVDFLLIDTEQEESRGLQTKSYINQIKGFETKNDPTTHQPKLVRSTRHYDDNYVTLIDGMTDLGNSRMGRTLQGNRIAEPYPGLISLNFLKFHVSIKKAGRNPVFNNDIGALIRARELAKKFSNSQSSYLTQAKHNIEGRIMHDLYKNKNETN